MGWGAREFENFHPPFLALLAMPFTFLSIDQAFVAWNMVMTGIYFVVVAILVRKALLVLFSGLAVLVVLPFWAPVFSTFCLGQGNAVLLLLLTMTWVFWRSDLLSRQKLAGVPLALATLIKLFPGFLLLLFLMQRRWSTLRLFSLTFILGLAVCAAIVGPEQVFFYFSAVLPRDAKDWGPFPINHSIHGVFLRMFSKNSYGAPLADLPFVAQSLIYSCSAVIVLASCLFIYRRQSGVLSVFQRDMLFWAQLVPLFLMSPITWQHSLVLMLPLFVLAIQSSPVSQYLRSPALVALFLFSFIDVEIVRWLAQSFPRGTPWYLVLAVGNLPFWGLLILGWAIWRTPVTKPSLRG